MAKAFIVQGDRTSHGGTVIGADFSSSINGKYMSRVCDLTVCPKCKGTFPISGNDSHVKDGSGAAYARDGDKTACGATLIATQGTATQTSKSNSGASSSSENNIEPSKAVAALAPGICLECLAAAAKAGAAMVVKS